MAVCGQAQLQHAFGNAEAQAALSATLADQYQAIALLPSQVQSMEAGSCITAAPFAAPEAAAERGRRLQTLMQARIGRDSPRQCEQDIASRASLLRCLDFARILHRCRLVAT